MPTIVKKRAKDTLLAIELDRGETLEYTLANGSTWTMEIVKTSAEVFRTTLKQLKVSEKLARTDFRFRADVKINGRPHTFERECSTQKSFYEPWLVDGVTIWFDCAIDIFDFLREKHGDCMPRKHTRWALQDATLRICPERLHPWCPLPDGGLKIEQCYTGEDCWLGAYFGVDAHGGLDINHKAGTPLWCPIDIHDHFYFNSVAMGHNNNRWRGIHHWPNGSQWILQAHHMTALTVPEHTPLKKGQQFAHGAGVLNGEAEHSHFVFKVFDEGELVLIDPWILFWQMYRDQDSSE
jgi:hypothetical protein